MKEILIILDGFMEKNFESLDLKNLILGNLDVNYKINMVDFSVENKDLDSLNCIMNILGYSSKEYDIGDRAYYEGLSKKINLKNDEIILRCNIVKIENEILTDFTGGKLPINIKDIVNYINIDNGALYHIENYKNLLLLKQNELNFKNELLYPPHFHIGDKISHILPKNKELQKTIFKSNEVFKKNNMNNCFLWPWGISKNINLQSFKCKYKKNATLISGIALVHGIGLALKIKSIKPKDCNGYYNTNLNDKLKNAINEIKNVDLVIVHINGLDELAHKKQYKEKLYFLEKINSEFLIPLAQNINNCKITITSDHRTDSTTGLHEYGKVPIISFII